MTDEQKLSDAERAFLAGLEKLTRETGIAITGCGCCDSPFMYDLAAGDLAPEAGYSCNRHGGNVSWVCRDPDNPARWEEDRQWIVKADPAKTPSARPGVMRQVLARLQPDEMLSIRHGDNPILKLAASVSLTTRQDGAGIIWKGQVLASHDFLGEDWGLLATLERLQAERRGQSYG